MEMFQKVKIGTNDTVDENVKGSFIWRMVVALVVALTHLE